MEEIYELKVNSELSFRWMLFEDYKDEIRTLRHRVFVEEQKLDEYVVDSPFDETGLHLGLFKGDELISALSMFVFPPSHKHLKGLGINNSKGKMVQFSRRAELPKYREKQLSSLMVAFGIKSVFALFEPEGLFASLAGAHRAHKNGYCRVYDFNKVYDTNDGNDDVDVLLIDDPDRLKKLYLAMRNFTIRQREKHNVRLPDLAHHIQNHSILTKETDINFNEVNHYLKPLSLADELPRLSAQSRLLFQMLKGVWLETAAKNQDIKRILDVGCGPGVYLGLISKLNEYKSKTLVGVDIDKNLIDYASFSHQQPHWLVGSVYQLPFEDNHFELVNASFLFIHLLRPYLAIKEIHRTLTKNGFFIVTDVDDSTFEGPEAIKDMVYKHADLHEGDRRIMLEMNDLVESAGFKLYQEHEFKVINIGTEEKPIVEDNTLKMGKWSMWGMFAFMGQRPEIEDVFDRAEEHYSKYNDDISICIKTKIYQKR